MAFFQAPLLSEIVEFQSQRTQNIFEKLGDVQLAETLTGTSYELSVMYGVVHHMLEGAQLAAKQKSKPLLDWFCNGTQQALEKFSISTSIGLRVAIAPSFAEDMPYLSIDSLNLKHALSTPPCPLIYREIDAVTSESTVLKQAVELAEKAQFSDLVGGCAGVISLCPAGIGGIRLSNWTVVSLPGTVYLTSGLAAPILARDLVHEAGHSWLNDAFEFFKCVPDPDVFFFSPWKNCMRPAFGFLHACWAFPLTVLISARIIDDCDDEIKTELRDYISLQRRALAFVESDFQTALKLVKDERIMQPLHDAFFEALNLNLPK